MPRRRRNDPAGLPERPNLATDPVRVMELANEVQRKIAYLVAGYREQMRLDLHRQGFNASLKRLQNAVEAPSEPGVKQSRLNPWIEFAINIEARKLAGRGDDVSLLEEDGPFVRQAAIKVAERSKAIRGRQGKAALRRYVEGVIAVIQEAVGKPVMAPRDKGDVYDPHLSGALGKTLRAAVDRMQPKVTDSELSYWVREIRKKYAGKPMRFLDMFPGYGATVEGETGAPVLRPPYRIERATISVPIYCP